MKKKSSRLTKCAMLSFPFFRSRCGRLLSLLQASTDGNRGHWLQLPSTHHAHPGPQCPRFAQALPTAAEQDISWRPWCPGAQLRGDRTSPSSARARSDLARLLRAARSHGCEGSRRPRPPGPLSRSLGIPD